MGSPGGSRGEAGATPAAMSTTAIIPSYCRGQVLLDTLGHLRELQVPPAEILVVDQTPAHPPEVDRQLRDWERDGTVRVVRLTAPSIPKAMNAGLLAARTDLVLFLDDDIVPCTDLIAAHEHAHAREQDVLIAGRVIQPWDDEQGSGTSFNSTEARWMDEFMGGNFSISRERAITLGGFDENFVRVAYRFEAEFAHRFRRTGCRIYFEPSACIRHLKVSVGGTRSFGDHLTTVRPDHAVGAYYYTLRSWSGWFSLKTFLSRPARAVATRHHLRNPWSIPATILAELSGMIWALFLFARGPRHLLTSRRPNED